MRPGGPLLVRGHAVREGGLTHIPGVCRATYRRYVSEARRLARPAGYASSDEGARFGESPVADVCGGLPLWPRAPICRKKGYLHHMVAPEGFRLLSGADDLETYRFGTRTARHQFCRHCGVACFYRPRADPRKFMVNVRCVDGVDLDRLRIEKFDGRSWELRPD